MKLIDRISIQRTVSMILDFILAVIKLFKEPNKKSEEEKRKPRWRR